LLEVNLKLIHQQQSNLEHACSIYLICVFRDEHLLLEYFIEYYQSLGVTHFIMVDNLSNDEGPEYLKGLKDINILLYQSNNSYEEAAMGTDWVNCLLKKHCIGQYCFTVDADELFVFDTERFTSLNEIIHEMEASGTNAVPATLLDMYPKQINDNYQGGSNFLAHSPFFDELNEEYYEERAVAYKTFAFKLGGVRKRIFGATACINKFPFFKFDFDPLGLSPGYHFFQVNGKVRLQSDKISLFHEAGVLLHFKFLKPNLGVFYQTRVNESLSDEVASEEGRRAARTWANENEQYAQMFANESSVKFFDHRYSKRLNEVGDLSRFFSDDKESLE